MDHPASLIKYKLIFQKTKIIRKYFLSFQVNYDFRFDLKTSLYSTGIVNILYYFYNPDFIHLIRMFNLETSNTLV